jgi:hypothetical protein
LYRIDLGGHYDADPADIARQPANSHARHYRLSSEEN